MNRFRVPTSITYIDPSDLFELNEIRTEARAARDAGDHEEVAELATVWASEMEDLRRAHLNSRTPQWLKAVRS